MYITINETKYDHATRSQTPQRVTYTARALTADIIAVGAIGEYRDDGFLLRQVMVDDYARQIAREGVLTLTNEPEPVPVEPAEKTPAELREAAYQTEAVIEYGGEMITVDEANKLYLQYLAEGDTDKTTALTGLIAAAKAQIRAEYPDEEVTEE